MLDYVILRKLIFISLDKKKLWKRTNIPRFIHRLILAIFDEIPESSMYSPISSTNPSFWSIAWTDGWEYIDDLSLSVTGTL
jgi:hypothetical protein